MKPLVIAAILALGPLVSPLAGPAEIADEDLPGGLTPLASLRENASNLWEENISHEDVRILLDMDFRTLDFDAVGVVFGGGTFEAQARLTAYLELRSLALYRVNDAINASSEGNLNLSRLYMGGDLNSTFITADELRTALAGEGLAVFQEQQQDAAEAFIMDAFPDMTVLSSRVAWSDVNPMDNAKGDADAADIHLLEPPIALRVVFDLQYLRRESLADLIDSPEDEGPDPEDPEEKLLEELKSKQQAAFYERSAFSVLGLTQLLNLGMSPGWDLVLRLTLPQGYTFEDVSPDVRVEDRHRTALVFTLAGDAEGDVHNPVFVAISNRYLVSVSLLAVVVLLGVILRFPVTLAWGRARAWRRAGTTIPVRSDHQAVVEAVAGAAGEMVKR